MFCTQCGTEALLAHRFCAKCGSALNNSFSASETILCSIPAERTTSVPSSAIDKRNPRGIGGWLLLLIFSMTVSGPLIGAGQIYMDLGGTEVRHPSLATLDKWQTFKAVLWLTYAIFATISLYGGLGLAITRKVSAVRYAKVALWLSGPLLSFLLGIAIPIAIFGNRPQVWVNNIVMLFGSMLGAWVWTAYLSKSKRVKATYGSVFSDITTDRTTQSVRGASLDVDEKRKPCQSKFNFFWGLALLMTFGIFVQAFF